MNILVTDDHQLFIDGIRHILSKLDEHIKITEANSAQQAIDILEADDNFDLVLIDLSMPGMDGMSILQRMHERKNSLPFVVISAEENIRTIKSALEMGALGFIPKSHNSQQMLSVLERILQGDIYIPDEVRKQIDNLESQRSLAESGNNQQLKESGISKRQYEVLLLLARGYSNKQIATTLYLTEHTVKAHISALFKTLKARNRTECVQLAESRGFLQ